MLVSSANLSAEDSRPSGRSFMKITNRIGPSTLPWGIPLVTGAESEVTRLILVMFINQ